MNQISQRLDLRQSQNLVMTPQLQQAIKLLQLSNLELAEFIESEIAQNPLLEKKEPESGDQSETPDTSTDGREEGSSDDMQSEFDSAWDGETEPQADKTKPDFDPGSANAEIGAGGSRSFDTLDDAFENSLARPETLREHLINQVHTAFDDPRDRLISAMIVDMIDEAGYVRMNIDELVQKLSAPPERVETILAVMKTFDPSGIFARDLKECLSLQLEDQGKCDAPMRILLDHLNLLADHNHGELARRCGVNETYLQDMISDIKSLNPKPAAHFEHSVVQTIVPDVLMKRLPKNLGGGWRVELNSDTLPRVLINNEYYTEVAQVTKDKQAREYITTQMNSANWLIKALDQRAQTILKVAGEIVEQQDAFFNYGIEFLKPLILKDIAQVIDMHESTVSRVTSNKYIGTPRGIFELKYFFSTALVSEDGTVTSAESVKVRIRTLIDSETVDTILSDDDIVDILKKEGIDLARRTVAKYREGMHIPSSVQRRKQKKNIS
ncbi:MAG: RNA polymerase factor sigma-54 [Alphaproteobacteria bacterium]|nr:RNA polymerase factor sigma-54 [Alphaproteobacteria bacterium]